MQILPDDPSRMSGKVRYNGEEHSYKITNADGIYTIYLDGDEVCSIDINNSQVPSSQSSSIFSPFINFSYANGKVAFRHAGRKYYYLDTQKYNSESVRKITESGKFILSTLLTLIPGVGPYVEGINFLRELYVINFGKRPKEKWYTVKIYCTKGYEYYAWKTYTYKDSARKHLQSVKWVYKKVL